MKFMSRDTMPEHIDLLVTAVKIEPSTVSNNYKSFNEAEQTVSSLHEIKKEPEIPFPGYSKQELEDSLYKVTNVEQGLPVNSYGARPITDSLYQHKQESKTPDVPMLKTKANINFSLPVNGTDINIDKKCTNSDQKGFLCSTNSIPETQNILNVVTNIEQRLSVVNKKQLYSNVSHHSSSVNDGKKSFVQEAALKAHIISHSSEKPYKCPTCFKRYAKKSVLTTHMKIHSGDKPFACSICSYRFIHKSNLFRHMKTHANTRSHVCSECNKGFNQKQHLNEHMFTHSGEKPFNCNTCKKSFPLKSTLMKHEVSHLYEKEKFKCNICSTVLYVKKHLENHIKRQHKHQLESNNKIYHKEKPFMCSTCGKCYTNETGLRYHVRNHTGEKPFKCSICQKCFTLRNNLKTHMVSHSSEKPFKCPTCYKRFAHKSVLTTHMKIHTGEKSFKCSVCRRCFARKYYLTQHMMTHSGEKPFPCSTCGRSFGLAYTLKQHMFTHSGEKPFRCVCCNQGFTQKSKLNEHIKTHPIGSIFSCSICNTHFTNKSLLEDHVLTHSSKMKLELSNNDCNDTSHLSDTLLPPSDNVSISCSIDENYSMKNSNSSNYTLSKCHDDLFECPESKIKISQQSLATEEKNTILQHVESKVFTQKPICDDMSSNDSDSNLSADDNLLNDDFPSMMSKGILDESPVLRSKGGVTFNKEALLSSEVLARSPVNIRPKNLKKKHKSTINKTTKVYKCTSCEKCFSEKIDHDAHMPCDFGEKQNTITICDKSSNTPFSCSICQKSFPLKRVLKRHMVTHSGEKPFSCSTCSLRFAHKSNLYRHMKTHANTRSHVCSVCNKGFNQKQHLNEHMFTHSGEKPFNCSTCEKSFALKSTLMKHEVSHFNKKEKFKCNICSTVLYMKKHLENHIKRQHKQQLESDNKIYYKEKPFMCSTCGKCYTNETGLRYHVRNHTGEKPFKCSICQKCFTLRNNLKTHMVSHSSEKPFKCPTCSKRFAHKSVLTTHMNIHTGEKSFKCSVCRRCFARKYYLTQHMKTHSGEKPFPCSTCGRSFGLAYTLKQHMFIHSGEKPFRCDSCNQGFTQKSKYNRHIKIHSSDSIFSCSICDTHFINKSLLEDHEFTHSSH